MSSPCRLPEFLLALALAVSAAACAAPTQDDLFEMQTRVLDYDYETTFAAAQGAMAAEGWIATETDKESGLLTATRGTSKLRFGFGLWVIIPFVFWNKAMETEGVMVLVTPVDANQTRLRFTEQVNGKPVGRSSKTVDKVMTVVTEEARIISGAPQN